MIIILVTSILGIVAISLYGLYFEDRLLTRVESLELTLKRITQASKGDETVTNLVKENELVPNGAGLGFQSSSYRAQI